MRLQSANSRHSECAHAIRIVPVGAIADHRIGALHEDVYAWREVDVDTKPFELLGLDGPLTLDGLGILRLSHRPCIRKLRDSVVKTNDTASFMIHHHEQTTLQRIIQLAEQLRKLFR